MCKYEDKCTQVCAQLICMYRDMYWYVKRQNYQYIRMYIWLEELPGVGTYANSCHFIRNNTSVNTNRNRQIYISAREHPPRTARSIGALQRSSSPAAVSASRCHAIHKGHMRPVLRVRQSYSDKTISLIQRINLNSEDFSFTKYHINGISVLLNTI